MITDHAHRSVRLLGRFAQRACGICGEPNDRHLSYGEQLADRLGGDPLDYVTGAPTHVPDRAVAGARKNTQPKENLAMTDPNDILFGSTVPSAKFNNLGDTVTGQIVSLSASQQTEYRKPGSTGPIKKLTWPGPDGGPMMQVIVTLQTSQRDPSILDDDGQRRVFVKGKRLTNSVREAVRVAGARKLEIGGVLTVRFVGEEDSGAGNPAKVYQVSYTRPQPGVDAANAALGMDQIQQPVQQPVQPTQVPLYTSGGALPPQQPVAQVPPVQQLMQPPAQPPVQQQLPTPAQAAQVASVLASQAAQEPATTVAGASGGGQMDLSSLPPDARALVEKMYAQQQGGQA